MDQRTQGGLVLFVLLIAVLLSVSWYPNSSVDVSSLISQLQSQVRGFEVELDRAAVGYNTNLDLVCSGVRLMEDLQISPSILYPFDSYESISSLEEFGSSFGFYFQQGSAAERAVTNQDVWKQIINPLVTSNYENCQLLPGGNAALIGNRLAKLGVSVLLGGPVGDNLETLVHPDVITLRKNHEMNNDNTYPKVEDEIHLILEYATGENWDTIVSQRANRFIISHDIQNSNLLAIEEFHRAIENYQPEVLIVAGAHLLEVLENSEREKRLMVLKESLESIPSTIAIHLEIAGVGDNSFLRLLAEALFPCVDSIGLNEQELGALYIATGGKQYSLSDFTKPSVEIATDAIEFLIQLPYAFKGNLNHEINRVHLHFLSFHVIAQRQQVRKEVFQWDRKRAAYAVSAGSLATTIQACGNDGNLPPVSELHAASDNLFSQFTSKHMEFWVAPVAICNVPKRTVGLGDCISATGIAGHFSKNNHKEN